jgi:hypothetical protein
MPIPLTQRDSRPHSQAEQDKEESFNARKRLKIPYHPPSDLVRRLSHYQELITRFLEDAEFRQKIICGTETWDHRAERKRSELTRARARKKGPKKSSRPDKKPPGYFTHLDKAVGVWYQKPTPEPAPEAVILASPFYRAEFDRHMADLIKEYHLDTPKLLFVWKPKLIQLALTRMHPQVQHYLKELRTSLE